MKPPLRRPRTRALLAVSICFGLIITILCWGKGQLTVAALTGASINQLSKSPRLSAGAVTLVEAPCGPQLVANSSDSGAGSLRDAIANACAGDTITFDMSPGHVTTPITLTSGELVIDKGLTIQGPGMNLLTISGNNASRIFNVTVASPGAVTLSGLTLANGNLASGNGAGINNGSTATINVMSCKLDGNSAVLGGGIYNSSTGNINVTDTTISNNLAGGGGVYNNSTGTITVTSSLLTGNTAPAINGGGIFSNTGTVNITNSTIQSNSALSGAGIYIQSSGTLTLTNVTLSANHAGAGGGGLFTSS